MHAVMPIFSWRNIATLFFLALPCFGLWMVVDGLVQGPNYFGPRVVVIEGTETETTTTTPGPRMGAASTSTVLWVNYHYTDQQGHVQQGRTWVAPERIPPENRTTGSEVFITVAVSREEGTFTLNRQVVMGLSLTLIFGLMSLPCVARVRWADKPTARKPGIRSACWRWHWSPCFYGRFDEARLPDAYLFLEF
jgi:hypothetical protein